MANSKFKIKKGANVAPQAAGANSAKGDIEVLDSDSRLHLHNGSTDTILVDQNTPETLTNKTINASNNTITNLGNINVSGGIDAVKIADGSVSNTEFQRLDGATGNIQAQIDENTQAILDNDFDITALQFGKQNAFSGLIDNRVIRANGTTEIQNSLVHIDDAGAITGATSIIVDNIQVDGNTISSTSGDLTIDPVGDLRIKAANDVYLESGTALRFQDLDNSHGTILKAATNLTANLTLTLPTTGGASGDALITDGSGNLSFTTITSGSGGGSYAIFDSTPQSIAAAGTITIALSSPNLLQTRRVQGNVANTEITTSTTPFGATPPTDGAMIILIGQSDTQPLKIPHNDASDGCILNGPAVLHKNEMLQLQWDVTADRYIEVSRSF